MTYFFDLSLQNSHTPGRYVFETSDGLEWNLVIEAPMGTVVISESLNNNSINGMTVVKTAGEDLAFGDVVYFKSDGKAWKADAAVVGKFPAIAMAAGTINENQAGVFLLYGTARNDAWNWSVGGILYLSTVAGEITQIMPPSTDDVVQILGVAHVDTHTIYFKPSIDYFTHT